MLRSVGHRNTVTGAVDASESAFTDWSLEAVAAGNEPAGVIRNLLRSVVALGFGLVAYFVGLAALLAHGAVRSEQVRSIERLAATR